MTINQISVFLENKPGQLAEFTRLLEENRIDMRALSIAETQDFGILRLIVDDPYKTVNVAKDAGYVCAITPVLAVEISDKPGSLVKMLTALGESGINVEYTYASINVISRFDNVFAFVTNTFLFYPKFICYINPLRKSCANSINTNHPYTFQTQFCLYK